MPSRLIILLIFLCFSHHAAAATARAYLDAAHSATGEGAILTVEIEGAQKIEPITLPEIPGLTVQPAGQNSQTSIINGVVRSAITYRFQIGSQQPGTYTIPALTLKAGAETLTTEALTLTVVGTAQQAPNAADLQRIQNDPKRFGWMTIETARTARQFVYQGEIVPVVIKLILPPESQAQLRGSIQPEGKGFTLHNVSQRPTQSNEIIDGKLHIVVQWVAGISATRPGTRDASTSIMLRVAVPDPTKLALRPRGTYTAQPASSALVEKDVTLISQPRPIEVKALPEEGKPNDFNGAVGSFSLAEFQIPTAWQTGEPQQIRVRVRGSGNFATMKPPIPQIAENWKSYTGKDQFQPEDQASFSGSKIFQFNTMPLKAAQTTMHLSMSYFDPDSGTYRSTQTSPHPITVTGNDIDPSTITTQPTEKSEDPLPEAEAIPWHTSSGILHKNWSLSQHPTFIPLTILLLTISAAAPLTFFLNRRLRDPLAIARRAHEKRCRTLLASLTKTPLHSDPTAHITTTRAYIAEKLGHHWNLNPSSLTLADIRHRLPATSPIIQLFATADKALFLGPQSIDPATTADLIQAARTELTTQLSPRPGNAKPQLG